MQHYSSHPRPNEPESALSPIPGRCVQSTLGNATLPHDQQTWGHGYNVPQAAPSGPKFIGLSPFLCSTLNLIQLKAALRKWKNGFSVLESYIPNYKYLLYMLDTKILLPFIWSLRASICPRLTWVSVYNLDIRISAEEHAFCPLTLLLSS